MFSKKIKGVLRNAPIFLSAAAIVAVIGYLSWLNHNDFERAMVKQSQDNITIIARSEAQSIEKYIGDIHEKLSVLSSDYRVRDALERTAGAAGVYPEVITASYKDMGKLVDSLYLMDGKGVVVTIMPFKSSLIGTDLSRAPDIDIMLSTHKEFTSGVLEGGAGDKVISNLHPIFDGGKFIGILRALISVDRINELVGHINSEHNVSALVIDDEAVILSSSNRANIGKNVFTLLGENPSHPEMIKMKKIIGEMSRGSSGVAVIGYLPAQTSAKRKKMLISFMPIRIGSENWSIAVAMDYNAIINPINRNARDNLIFAGFVFVILGAAGIIFYRIEKKNTELSISETCLDLINKQLHLEIEKRKDIEKKLNECIRGGKQPK